MAQTPTSRTLQWCRKNNIYADVVERYNCYTKRRNDYLGFIDLIMLKDNKVVGVQVTSRSNISSRVRKIKQERADEARAWLETGSEIIVIGWGKMKRNNRHLWEQRQVAITLDDLGDDQ